MKVKMMVTSLGLLLGPSALAQSAPFGVVLDLGSRTDRSFNQAALAGVQRAQKELGVKVDVYDTKVDADRQKGLNLYAGQKKQLVIGLGFNFLDPVKSTAFQYPGTKFAVVDALPSGANTAGLTFREQEGSFMVGYMAGLQSSTGVVGFVGGMDSPVIHKFDAGFTAGVKFACPNCTVLSRYLGKTPSAFNDIPGATALAGGLKAKGADVIYAAAGASGRGVISFVTRAQCIRASELPAGVKFRQNAFAGIPKSAPYKAQCTGDTRPLFFIGVDSNQNYLGDTDNNPKTLNHGLTSMVKRIDTALFTLIQREVKKEKWRSGESSFGLENGGVDYALDEYNEALVPQTLLDKLTKVREMVITKLIKIPTQ
ncbi:BMP family lipoprotein [Deinococcus ficus]|uniref:BMP family lipoprotein n=1 Tax=Deinococcus ficus TaxID=317577 RepID=UPI00174A31D0|nr:BMP family ABC transporter substrate-binding protein [Deinococcus ficus]GHF89854.1 membrane protein [Deinococcus ficus]